MAFGEKAVRGGGKLEALLTVRACQDEMGNRWWDSVAVDLSASGRCGESRMVLGKVGSGGFEAQ